jgi:CDP-diacylglycerol--glycerol-3-phosphate 3-phosphatidyltransferase
VTNSKPVQMSTANIITLSRVPLLICVVILLYLPWAWARFVALVLLPILYLMDWFDGYVARYKDQVSDLGSVLDIAIDRVVENVLWIVFAHQYRVPVWIPILFIIRSFVIDGLRSYALQPGAQRLWHDAQQVGLLFGGQPVHARALRPGQRRGLCGPGFGLHLERHGQGGTGAVRLGDLG